MNSLFSLFIESHNTFQGQEPGENVILFLRRHPIVIIFKIIGLILAYSAPILISLLFLDFISKNDLFIIYLFAISIWNLFIWVIIFYSLTMYTLDVWIVTDRRVIDSTQHGFFNRTVSELHVTRIQDIYVKVEGPLATFVNYGNLLIQTAGTEERFIFKQIPKPVQVKDAIMKIAFSQKHTHEDASISTN
jgi:uncharacterized membrane protein YdbT with pleckstrin-like domain